MNIQTAIEYIRDALDAIESYTNKNGALPKDIENNLIKMYSLADKAYEFTELDKIEEDYVLRDDEDEMEEATSGIGGQGNYKTHAIDTYKEDWQDDYYDGNDINDDSSSIVDLNIDEVMEIANDLLSDISFTDKDEWTGVGGAADAISILETELPEKLRDIGYSSDEISSLIDAVISRLDLLSMLDESRVVEGYDDEEDKPIAYLPITAELTLNIYDANDEEVLVGYDYDSAEQVPIEYTDDSVMFEYNNESYDLNNFMRTNFMEKCSQLEASNEIEDDEDIDIKDVVQFDSDDDSEALFEE